VTTGGSTTLDPRCLAACQALAAGDDEAMRAHASECAACAFLASLGPQLSAGLDAAGAGRAGEAGGLGAFEAVLERAIESGEPLLSRYRVEGIVARGGQGVVCRAHDEELGSVALKLLRCHPEAPALREGRALRVRHLGVCRVFNVERHGDIRMVVMEHVAGEDLERALPKLSARARLRVFRAICDAVAAIHEARVLHLDLKPRNILLPTREEPIVADFGLAAEMENDGGAMPAGFTPGYAPAEQVRFERVDRRADIYALGKILARIDPSRRHRKVIARATQARAADRYPDVAALVRDLDRPARRLRVALASIGATAAVLGIAALLGGSRCEFELAPILERDASYLACVSSLPPTSQSELLVRAARALSAEFKRVMDLGRVPVDADFEQVSRLIEFIQAVDPESGHALYYGGEKKRWLNQRDRDGTAYLRSHEDFYRYLEIEPSLAAGEGDEAEACYGAAARGYCRQRTAWIRHDLANDFYRAACRATSDARTRLFALAREHAARALELRPAGFGGTTQGVATMDLAARLADARCEEVTKSSP
jgi:hypothetical protein